MNTILNKRILQFAYAFLLLSEICLLACKKDEILKDVKGYVSSDILVNPMSITFRDANSDNGQITVPITLEITGVDAAKIFSVLGKQKALAAEKDIFHVAMKKKHTPEATNPLVFTVTAKAEGYLDAVKTFILTESGYQGEVMKMVKISAPPKGVTTKKGTTTTSAVTSDDFYIETEASNSNTEKMGFRIKKGTNFFGGADGKTPLTGAVSISIGYMSGSDVDNDELIPGGNDGGTQVMELNGKPKKPSSAAMAGCSVIDVYVGGVKATNFTNSNGVPLETIMTLNDNFENPDNNFEKLKVGDQISIWSMSEKIPLWQEEIQTKIAKNANNKLEVTIQHNHLSSFMAGWFILNSCFHKAYKNPLTGAISIPDAVSQLTITSNLTSNAICGNGGTGFFYTELIGKKKGKKLASGYFEYYNGRALRMASLLSGSSETAANWRIYAGDDVNKKELLHSQDILLCNSGTLNVGSALPKSLQIGVAIDAECEGLALLLPSMPVQYRESGNAVYRTLGYVNNGTGCAGNLQKGKKYDFKIAFGGILVEPKGLIVPSQDSTVFITYPNTTVTDTVKWQYQGATKDQIILKYQNIKLPTELCDEYKRYLGG
jgi:hypothetical protein